MKNKVFILTISCTLKFAVPPSLGEDWTRFSSCLFLLVVFKEADADFGFDLSTLSEKNGFC